jgi:hypothetical protein
VLISRTVARSTAIRVVVAADSLVVRDGIRRPLELDRDVEVVASSGDLDASWWTPSRRRARTLFELGNSRGLPRSPRP